MTTGDEQPRSAEDAGQEFWDGVDREEWAAVAERLTERARDPNAFARNQRGANSTRAGRTVAQDIWEGLPDGAQKALEGAGKVVAARLVTRAIQEVISPTSASTGQKTITTDPVEQAVRHVVYKVKYRAWEKKMRAAGYDPSRVEPWKAPQPYDVKTGKPIPPPERPPPRLPPRPPPMPEKPPHVPGETVGFTDDVAEVAEKGAKGVGGKVLGGATIIGNKIGLAPGAGGLGEMPSEKQLSEMTPEDREAFWASDRQVDPATGLLQEPAAETPAETHVPTADYDAFVALFHGGGGPFTADGRLAAGKGADVAQAALSYVGTPFAWGGRGYDGVDASSLVRAAYRAIGVDIPRLGTERAVEGERVSLPELQPGDLVMWKANDRGGTGAPHAAVHVGNGYVVEAPGPGLNVRRRLLDEDDLDAYGVRPMDPRRARPPAPFYRER